MPTWNEVCQAIIISQSLPDSFYRGCNINARVQVTRIPGWRLNSHSDVLFYLLNSCSSSSRCLESCWCCWAGPACWPGYT